jgi:hypothetical protein
MGLTFSSHSLAILSSAASEVLLLIWEGQPRHARQAHWGMDSTQHRPVSEIPLVNHSLIAPAFPPTKPES